MAQLEEAAWSQAHRVVQYAFLGYLAVNIGAAFILVGMRQVSLGLLSWTVFAVASIDALFLSALVVITGGLQSVLFWLYPVLILRNSVSVTAAGPQVGLNLLVCVFYTLAAVVEATRRQVAPVVSLYVNHYNKRALAAYRAVGFRQEGTFATVLF